jgi:hypothetical protein
LLVSLALLDDLTGLPAGHHLQWRGYSHPVADQHRVHAAHPCARHPQLHQLRHLPGCQPIPALTTGAWLVVESMHSANCAMPAIGEPTGLTKCYTCGQGKGNTHLLASGCNQAHFRLGRCIRFCTLHLPMCSHRASISSCTSAMATSSCIRSRAVKWCGRQDHSLATQGVQSCRRVGMVGGCH